MRKWWIVPTIMIVSLIFGIIGAAWSQRPIVEYTLSDYPENFDTADNGLEVWLNIKNTGASYAPLNLVLEAKNGNITVWKVQQGETLNGTHFILHYDLSSGMENYERRRVEIEPIGNPENVTVSLAIENLADWSIPSGFICQFLEPHGYVTSINYVKTDTTTYAIVS